MSVDRRATCTRCFVYGDVRSVESTLETFHAWRDPHDVRRRVETLVLAGDALHVLATAQGIRDIERLRGIPFGFDLACTGAIGSIRAGAACDEAPAPPADDRAAPILLIDPDETMERTTGGRRALNAALGHAAEWHSPLLLVLHDRARLADLARRALDSRLALDIVRYEGHNPFLLPAVEGFFADRAPRHIALGGQGPRVLSAALGAGDFFLERAGDPARLSRRARHALVRRACIVDRFTIEAPSFGALEVATELQRLDVRVVEGTFAGDPDGILVHPVAA
jgi:hypothetical protein